MDDQPNVPSLYLLWTGDQNGNFYWPAEMLELNDCLYRNLNRHEYLVIMDLDEMIVPLNLPDWHQLLPQFTVRLYLALSAVKFLISCHFSLLVEPECDLSRPLASTRQ